MFQTQRDNVGPVFQGQIYTTDDLINASRTVIAQDLDGE
jgi:hypothetical protein